MKKAWLSLVALAVFACWSVAAELKVTGDTKVKPFTLVSLKVEGAPPGYTILWDVYPEDDVSKSKNQKLRSTYEFVAPPGKYKVKVRAFKDEDVLEQNVEVVIGTAPVDPVKPPVPPVDPVKPPLNPSPFKEPGFRVMIVFESGKVLSIGQHSAVYGKKVRDYLDEKCPVGVGGLKDWRIFDQNDDLSAVEPIWKAALARERKSVPWIVVGDGKVGYEGPIDKDGKVDGEPILQFLKKYGG